MVHWHHGKVVDVHQHLVVPFNRCFRPFPASVVEPLPDPPGEEHQHYIRYLAVSHRYLVVLRTDHCAVILVRTIIIYVKCNVSISDEQFFVTCEWNGKKFNELLTYSEIEDTFKRMYNEQLNTYWIVVNRVIGIIKSKLNKQIQEKLIDKH